MTETAASDGLPRVTYQIGVVGAGYVGMPTALILAERGHRVVVAERDGSRRDALARGHSPMMEESLEELLGQLQQSGHVRLVATAAEAATGADIVFLCVATPTGVDGHAEMGDVDVAVTEIRDHLKPSAIVVNKSTVPVGTADHVEALIGRSDIRVVSNPEFLREGRAVRDSRHPDRVVVGANDPSAATVVATLFGDGDTPRVLTDARTAELVKYSANAFLAMKLSFVNSMAQLCDALGADVTVLARGIGLDPRIGSAFLSPGPGWGGSCLPKDVAALRSIAEEAGVTLPLVSATIEVNANHVSFVVDQCATLVGRDLATASIGVLGLTFKANTGDRRDSPALAVVAELRRRGATVRAYDPTVPAGATDDDLAGLTTVGTDLEALASADLVIVLTEWPEFSHVLWGATSAKREDAVIVDTRGVVDVAAAHSAGWRVAQLGRRVQ
jgi:UDPglucose 6-dehydrogenase